MNIQLQTTAIVRQRGQLTIPRQIKKINPWLQDNIAVTIIASNGQVILKPNVSPDANSKKRWEKAWEMIQLARSFRGKRGNLSKFIAQDRYRH